MAESSAVVIFVLLAAARPAGSVISFLLDRREHHEMHLDPSVVAFSGSPVLLPARKDQCAFR